MLKININNVHIASSEDINHYVDKKFGRLDRYISRRVRDSAHVEVYLKESKIKTKSQCTCEVIVHLPKEEFVIKETTVNIFAAVDIVEAKLKNQLLKYKDKYSTRPKVFAFARHHRYRNL
jgi:putative sigma-54 modulation protein